MSYVIKKQKFYKLYEKIKETCSQEEYPIPKLLKDYDILEKDDFSDESLQDELKKFLEIFPEFSDIALNLNPEQEEIVTYEGDKFLSIEAGPGAGKTRVLIEKVNYMVNNLGVDPETLLIITFSTKAAEELKERLSEGDLLKSDVQRMQISTIHSFCGRILEEDGQIGLNVISDEAGEKNLLFIGKHMEELGFVNECFMFSSEIQDIESKYNEYCSFGVDIDGLIDHIEKTRPISDKYVNFVRNRMAQEDGKYPYDEVMSDDECKQSRYNAKYLQIAKSYKIYEDILKREKAIDYSHMQKNALEVVHKEGFETQFTNILIDEFQDTDPIQMELFEELMKTAETFTVVGDINQSIYGFRGSNINPFEYLAKHHKDEFEFKSLPTNYRSTCEIIDVSEEFIKHQRPKDSALKKAKCGRGAHNKVYYLVNDDDKGFNKVEANDILSIILHLKDRVNKLSDIGILLRSVRPSSSRCIEPLKNLLKKHDIPFQINSSDLIEQPEIKSVLTLFNHLVTDDDPHKNFFNKWEQDWLNLRAYADQILFELSDETKEILYTLQKEFEDEVVSLENELWLRNHKSGGINEFGKVFKRDEDLRIEIFDSVERPVLTNENLIKYGITNEDDLEFFRRLNAFKEELYAEDVKYYERPTVSEVYLKLLTDITGFLNEDLILKNEAMINNLAQITDSLSTFVDVRFDRDIRGAFWFIYRTIGNRSGYKEDVDGIQIMTVHASKGLEFPVVIVPSLKEGTYPKKFEDPSERDYIFPSPVYFTPYEYLKYPKFDKDHGPEKSHKMEEERIIYVAMTRAEDTLILSSIVDKCDAAKHLAIKSGEFGNLPKGPKRIQKAINSSLDKCKFIDINNIDINVPERKEDEVDESYCIDLSFTALENYNNCHFRYKLANAVGFNVTEKQEIDEGIFVHKALELINKMIIANDNVYVGDEEVIKTVTELFEKSHEELLEEDSVKYQKDLKEVTDNVVHYYENYGKYLKILDSEYPFYLKDKNYALSGVVDLIYEVDGKLGIIDYKNTRLEGKYKDKFRKQLHLYVLALRDQNQEYEGREITELKVYAIKSKKMLTCKIDEAYIEELKLELERVAKKIHDGKFESSKCDDCKYCHYKNICNQQF